MSTTNNHGTHVTALAAGYVRDRMGRVTFRGAAPAAQILSMKIFPNGSGGGTDDTIILRALEDAWNLGADVAPGGVVRRARLAEPGLGCGGNGHRAVKAAGGTDGAVVRVACRGQTGVHG